MSQEIGRNVGAERARFMALRGDTLGGAHGPLVAAEAEQHLQDALYRSAHPGQDGVSATERTALHFVGVDLGGLRGVIASPTFEGPWTAEIPDQIPIAERVGMVAMIATSAQILSDHISRTNGVQAAGYQAKDGIWHASEIDESQIKCVSDELMGAKNRSFEARCSVVLGEAATHVAFGSLFTEQTDDGPCRVFEPVQTHLVRVGGATEMITDTYPVNLLNVPGTEA